MASGTINLSSTSHYIKGRIVWQSVGQTVSCSLQLSATNGHTGTSGTWGWRIGIGSHSDRDDQYASIKDSWKEIAFFTAKASGNTVSISASCDYPSGTSQAGHSCYGSKTVTIAAEEPEVPLASTIITASDAYFGGLCYVSWIPTSKDYGFSIAVSCGDYSTTYSGIKPNSLDLVRHGVTIPYNYIYAVESGITKQATVTLTTLKSNQQIGTASTVQILCTIPDNDETKPSVTAFSIVPSPNPFDGAYVQGQTGVTPSVLTAAGKYGATIVSTYFRVEGKLYGTAQNAVSDVIAQFGRIAVTAFAVDSRGFTSNGLPIEIETIPYGRPKLRPVQGRNRITVMRCDSDGNSDADGTHLIIMAKREYSPVFYQSFQQNFCSIRFRYKPDTSTAWSGWTEILAANTESDEVVSDPLIGTLAAKSTYQVEIQAIDTLGESGSTIITVSSERIYDHADGARGAYGFGKYAEIDDSFDIAESKVLIVRGSMVLRGEAYMYMLDLMHPIGSVLETVDHNNPDEALGGVWVLMETTESAYKWRRTE